MTTLVVQADDSVPTVNGTLMTLSPKVAAKVGAVPLGNIVGLESAGEVLWCRQSKDGLLRIPFGEVICVSLEIRVPQGAKQLLRTVLIEGPQDKMPARIDVSELSVAALRVGDLALPTYCETVGVSLTQKVFVDVASKEL